VNVAKFAKRDAVNKKFLFLEKY